MLRWLNALRMIATHACLMTGRAAIRVARFLDRWLWGPVKGAVKGKVNWPEWGRIVVIAMGKAALVGFTTHGLAEAALDATRDNAATIFAPAIASVMVGLADLIEGYAHRRHRGVVKQESHAG